YHSMYGNQTLVFSSMVFVEEGMEKAAIVLFLYALLSYIERQHIAVRIVMHSSEQRATGAVPTSPASLTASRSLR
ncbi:MAG: hypothetical protein ACRECQ_10945, partial [Burkholderiaceae bacterium]